MDKIFSARVDETIIQQIKMLANRLQTTKKAIIEGAVTTYAEKIVGEENLDILKQTAGAWQRNETPEQTIKKVRLVMKDSMEKHQK